MADETYIKRSRIHGRGLFAGRRIARGQHIGSYEGPGTSRNGKYVLWVQVGNGRYRGIDGRNALHFLNHSRRPNAVFHGPELFSLRQIRPHEEITIDYGPDWSEMD